MSIFFIWMNQFDERYYSVTKPKGIKSLASLKRGNFREDWPADVVCQANPGAEGMVLPDNVFGTGFLLISQKIRDILLRYQMREDDFLPTSIAAAGGEVLSESYYFINFLPTNAYPDRGKSGVPEGSHSLKEFEKLVIRRSSPIARLDGLPQAVVVGANLIKKLEEAGCTGLCFPATEEFHSPSDLNLPLPGKSRSATPQSLSPAAKKRLLEELKHSASAYVEALLSEPSNFSHLIPELEDYADDLATVLDEISDSAWERNGEAWFETSGEALAGSKGTGLEALKAELELPAKYSSLVRELLKSGLS